MVKAIMLSLALFCNGVLALDLHERVARDGNVIFAYAKPDVNWTGSEIEIMLFVADHMRGCPDFNCSTIYLNSKADVPSRLPLTEKQTRNTFLICTSEIWGTMKITSTSIRKQMMRAVCKSEVDSSDIMSHLALIDKAIIENKKFNDYIDANNLQDAFTKSFQRAIGEPID